MERNAFDLLGAEFSLGPAGQRRFNLDKMSSGMRFLLEANILAAPCVEFVKACPHCEYGSVAFIEDMGEFYFGNCDSCGANVLASKQELTSCSFSESNFASFLVERLCDACQPENNGDYWFLGPAATCRSRWHIFFSISPTPALCNDILRQRNALLLAGLQMSVLGEVQNAIRDLLQLDELTFSTGTFEKGEKGADKQAIEAYNIQIGKYVTDKVMLRYTQSLSEDMRRYGIRYDFTDRFSAFALRDEKNHNWFGFEARFSF